MLKRDYILAMIEDFGQALALIINWRKNGNTDPSLDMIKKCYSTLHVTEDQLINTDLEKLSETLQKDEKPPLPFLEILAGLLMEESYLTEGKEALLLNRALEMLKFVDQHDDTFSFERLEKIELVKSLLQN